MLVLPKSHTGLQLFEEKLHYVSPNDSKTQRIRAFEIDLKRFERTVRSNTVGKGLAAVSANGGVSDRHTRVHYGH